MNLSFTDTRSRRADPVSSKLAAKTAASGKAGELRRRIKDELWATPQGLTARELSQRLGVDYYAVQRRISETANIRKTAEMRDGAMVWEWVAA